MKREVLNAFKRLHRARQFTFKDDSHALAQGRFIINDNFRKNKSIGDQEEIKRLVQLALDAERELRTNVIQAVEKEGVFELRITEQTTKLDNVNFNPYAVPTKRTQKEPDFKCCRGTQSGCHCVKDKDEKKT